MIKKEVKILQYFQGIAGLILNPKGLHDFYWLSKSAASHAFASVGP